MVMQGEYISGQKIDELTKTVVSSMEITDNLVRNPPQIIGFDYQNNQLVFKLSEPITLRWAQQFGNMPQSGIVNFLPHTYHISTDRREIRINVRYYSDHEHVLQDLTNQVKHHVSVANTMYKESLIRERQEREQLEREGIERQKHEEMQRLKILKSIKI